MYFRFVFLTLFLTACSPSVLITPHKTDVQQGNVVTEDMLDKIKPGMTKSQVRFVLGTPLISDAFHGDRWDYVYRFDKKGELTEKRRLTVVFEGDTLKTVEGTALPPSKNIAGTRLRPAGIKAADNVPEEQKAVALAPASGQLAGQPPVSVDSKPEGGPGTPPQTAANAETTARPVPVQAQAEQPKRSFGERFLRLFGIGKNEESLPPEEQPAAVVAAKPAPIQAEVEQPKRSFGERFVRLFGIGKDKEPAPPEENPEAQQEAEPPTNTVMTADRSPPPKRSTGERFMRLIGVKEKEGDDPAPPVTTEVNTSIPRFSSLTFKQVASQILGLEDDKDREKKAAAEDIEPGEKETSGAQGSTWQRFKRLIGVSSDQEEFSTEPVKKEQQTSPAGNATKPEAAKTGAAKPEGAQVGDNRSAWQKILDAIGLGRKKSDGPQ
jgi:outer membrane protein assembly factor BamE